MVRLTYSKTVSTLALVVALGSGAVAGASALITGAEVKDGSLSGADIRNHSLSGLEIKSGSLSSSAFSLAARANLRGATGATGAKGEAGSIGPQGPAGQGVATTTTTGPDVSAYVDQTTLATQQLPAASDYVLFARVSAHNTGTNDDNLNCGLFADSSAFGGGGTNVLAGSTATFSVVGAISLTAPTSVRLACQGNNVTTFDLSNITIRTHNLG